MPRERLETEPAPHVWPHPRRVIGLSRSTATAFDLTADDAAREKIAAFLGISRVDALRFKGELAPMGSRDWQLSGRLTAEVAQPCVVTLEPVDETIDAPVRRDYVHEWSGGVDLDPDADDDVEELGDVIDLGAVAIEELALALDPFPHAEGVERVEMRATPPGAQELDDDAVKPFAGLAELREKLTGGKS